MGSSSKSSKSQGSGHRSQDTQTTNTYTPPTQQEVQQYKHQIEQAGGIDAFAQQNPDAIAQIGGLNKAKELIAQAMQNLNARTAIITTPEKAEALMNMNSQLDEPYQVKGAYLI